MTMLDIAQAFRETAAGLNLAARIEPGCGGQPPKFSVVEQHGWVLRVTPELVRLLERDKLHAILAAFAAGATEIKWRDGTTLTLVIEPPVASDGPVDSGDTGE